LRIRITPGFWTSRVGLAILGSVLLLFIICTSVFAYYYVKFGKLIDERLSGTIYQNTSRVYAAPETIFTGESLKQEDVESYLVRAGYAENEIDGSPGQFHSSKKSIEIHPSEDSYFKKGNALRIDFEAKSIARITSLPDGAR